MTIKLALALVASLVAGAPAFGMLVSSSDFRSGGGPQPAVERYTDAGVFLGSTTNFNETIDGLAVGPPGDIYAIGNTLGFGSIQHINAATGVPFPNGGGPELTSPVGAAIGWGGHLFVGSFGFGSGM